MHLTNAAVGCSPINVRDFWGGTLGFFEGQIRENPCCVQAAII